MPPDRERLPPTEEAIMRLVVRQIAALRQLDPAVIDPDRPFNEFGVDSLDAITVIGELEERFAITIEPAEMFDHPTPRGFARILAARSAHHVL